jgi:hypothetical protein
MLRIIRGEEISPTLLAAQAAQAAREVSGAVPAPPQVQQHN